LPGGAWARDDGTCVSWPKNVIAITDIDSGQSTNAALLGSAVGESTKPSGKQRGAGSRDWLRQLRVQPLFRGFGRPSASRDLKEQRKIAMYHNRRIAALHTLLHLIPLGGAMTLLIFQWTRFFTGTTPDPTILQFVAKFHELLMQVSIVETLLCIVRTEAVRGFVPFGALSGMTQATHLSYLWSFGFVSLFTSTALRGWRKLFLAVAIPLLLALTAVVGPSSAVLMIPRPNSPLVRPPVTMYANQSIERFFPSRIGREQGLVL
jgi:hypothetical protein